MYRRVFSALMASCAAWRRHIIDWIDLVKFRGIKMFSDLHPQGLTPARLVSFIVWLDCACQGCPNKTRRFAQGFLFVAPPGQCSPSRGRGWLGRRAGDFQPEF